MVQPNVEHFCPGSLNSFSVKSLQNVYVPWMYLMF